METLLIWSMEYVVEAMSAGLLALLATRCVEEGNACWGQPKLDVDRIGNTGS